MESAQSLTAAWKRDWREVEAELSLLWQSRPNDYRSLIEPTAAASVPWAGDIAHVKRFGERWRADRAFREALPESPRAVAARYRLGADPEELRVLWDPAGSAGEDERSLPLSVRRYKLFVREKLLHREKLRAVECVPTDRRHRLWRARQIGRTLGQLGPRKRDGIVHAPFAIELSDGCSVGCWFCGLSARRKTADFLYTPENGRLWRDTLAVLRRIVGPAAATGFCYWATDPLDNPDYERFCVDFADICGRFPQTTTALPHRDPERVRRLLALSAARGCTINRFSILTLAIFNRVMEAFSAEELLHCEILPQNPEAKVVPGNSGRAQGAARLERRAAALGAGSDVWEAMPTSIACVSGFLLNMVHRSVRLIAPCPASRRWPNGYWVFEEARFADAPELEGVLETMMQKHMRTALRAGDTGRLRPDISHRSLSNGFELSAFGERASVRGEPFVPALGEALAAGDRTVGGIAVELERRHGQPAERTMHLLNRLFDAGYLDEEPSP